MALVSRAITKTNFIYELGGDVGEIDVFELAPTLLSLGQLVQEANRTLYPEGQEIAVNVKPFKQGSFIVDVVLFFPSHLQQLLDLIQHTSPEQVKHLLESLGIIGTAAGAATVSVLGVIKKLKGRVDKVEELKPGEFRYSSDNNSVTVGQDVHNLIQNSTITQNIVNVYSKPLEKENVDRIDSYLEGEKEQTKVEVTKDDAPAIKEFADTVGRLLPAEQGEEIVKENVTTMFLNPKRGAFEGDGMQWSFHKGSDVITATIKDPVFLNQVASGEIRPNHHDLMEVQIVEKQRVIGTEVKAPVYEIPKVIKYTVGGPAQQSLLPPPTEDAPPKKLRRRFSFGDEEV
jgi:hypothetical protein